MTTQKPWGAGDPVAWALTTERITAGSEADWRLHHLRDPQGIENLLQQLTPVPLGRLDEMLRYAQGHTGGTPYASAASRTGASPSYPTSFRNAVEELRVSHPTSIRAAEQAVAPPTMFPSGDFPAVTASGVDPGVLRVLPWRARIVAAWTKDRQDVMRLLDTYTGSDGELQAIYDLSNHAAVREYTIAVEQWYATAGVGEPLLAGEYEELTRAEQQRFWGRSPG